ncbi:MAG: hypothetical protein KJ904_08655 [Alphaproteobacteria bacterium]|nr:hypothetical protein [Alphaproteobacteria bacterium]MBU0798966.1 hypothetical protein [Alphaproteobacteria bacterium]MBU0887221.1 hypothetical protein [Alphaproteobacteria bacterium]MBU1812251.1 hypothetical protein [Alphaproteobacteria bacterium]
MPPQPPADLSTITLGELLRTNYALIVRCAACGHTGPADVLTAYRRHGAAARVTALAERLRCTRCDGRGGVVVSITPPAGL